VLIPSYGRPDKLRACLRGLCAQTVPPAEVVVGLDGGTDDDAAALLAEFEASCSGLRVLALPKQGYIPVRARLLAEAKTELLLSLNDDVRVSPGLVEAHERAHGRRDSTCLATGPAPWVTPEFPTLFDRVVGESDLIFFDPERAIGDDGTLPYRYCVGLNFSCPIEAAREAGGFHDLPDAYGYDDIELAFRLRERFGAPVVFARDAVVVHDHRYTPESVMRREYELGRATWMYRRVNPAFCADLFGRDIADESELAFSREYIARMRGDAERIERSFMQLVSMPADAADGRVMPVLAEHWIPLKRYLWRLGLLDEATGEATRKKTAGAGAPAAWRVAS